MDTYRESVRTHYHELRTGLRDCLPPDLARPLTVGQKVIARHPKTREIHDGSILTVDRSRCRVQFDRPELGVELVRVFILQLCTVHCPVNSTFGRDVIFLLRFTQAFNIVH